MPYPNQYKKMSSLNPTENKGSAQTISSDSNILRTCLHERVFIPTIYFFNDLLECRCAVRLQLTEYENMPPHTLADNTHKVDLRFVFDEMS